MIDRARNLGAQPPERCACATHHAESERAANRVGCARNRDLGWSYTRSVRPFQGRNLFAVGCLSAGFVTQGALTRPWALGAGHFKVPGRRWGFGEAIEFAWTF